MGILTKDMVKRLAIAYGEYRYYRFSDLDDICTVMAAIGVINTLKFYQKGTDVYIVKPLVLNRRLKVLKGILESLEQEPYDEQ